VPLFALLAGMVQVPAARANQQPFAIYVSPGGNDAWSGQRPAPNPARDDGPCATLARAQTVLRSIRSTEGGRRGATIVIRAGTYYLTAPLSFGAEDSGLPKEPITIQAYPGETVTLSGGRPVTNWRSYKGNVLQADVSAILGAQEGNTPSLPTNPINEGVGDRTLAQRNELFCDGERMELARWPNLSTPVAGGGWAMTAGVPVKGSRTQFYYQGEAPVRWVHPEQAQVHLFGAFDWLDEYRGIASVDTTRHLITLSKPTIFPIAPGHRFYVRNVFEELDAPCEWYLDNHSGTIYFYPPKPSDSTDNVQLSVLSSIVSLKQAHDIVLLGLTMEDVTGAAIYEEGCSRVRIEACEIRNVGKIGVCANASDYCEIEGCQIHDTGSDAILLRCGDRKTLDSSKMVVCNNNIFRFGRLVECYH